jgi:hypothetical protein
MSLIIDLTPEEEQKLRERAADFGQEPGDYAASVLRASLEGRPTLSEILAPYRRQVEESGISDEELDSLFEEAREAAFQARRTVRP